MTDPKKVLLALRWVIDEMEKRYKIFAKAGVRNITSFNGRPAKKTQKELDADIEAGAVARKFPERGRSRLAARTDHRSRAKTISSFQIGCRTSSSSSTSWPT